MKQKNILSKVIREANFLSKKITNLCEDTRMRQKLTNAAIP